MDSEKLQTFELNNLGDLIPGVSTEEVYRHVQ
jgi:hypothetical protein